MKPTYEELAVQLANAESKCRALAAENSSKSRCLGFFASVIKSGEKWTSVCEHEYSKALKNPATDAFLAEARAQGVEMFSEKFGGGTPLSNLVKEVAADFAAKLRKGVAQ
ncbi:hypothetical protein LUU99_003768 [Salmonella enterica subsp. enterica serovar Newport]|nr:hypothetical protein [Salmonella enterica subsp. enterica serovar Kimberley]EIQ2295769.1 hypothetical protein [Salmonella enterica subsp. enterica serovar Newport]